MKIVMNIPDSDDAERMVGGGCRKWKYQDTVQIEEDVDVKVKVKVPDGEGGIKLETKTETKKVKKDVPNPQSRADFVKKRLLSHWRNEVRIQEREEARGVSDKQVDESVDKIVLS